MAARKYHITHSTQPPAQSRAHAAPATDAHDPVESPALLLQNVLRDAGFESVPTRHYRRLVRTMLVLSLACVYAVGVLMLTGGIGA